MAEAVIRWGAVYSPLSSESKLQQNPYYGTPDLDKSGAVGSQSMWNHGVHVLRPL